MNYSEWSERCWAIVMVTMSSEYSIYLYREMVDLRKGISGLSGIVRSEMKMNPNTAKSLYVLSGNNLRIKKLRYCQQRVGAGRTSDVSLNEIRADGKMMPIMVRERTQRRSKRIDAVLHVWAISEELRVAGTGEQDGSGTLYGLRPIYTQEKHYERNGFNISR